MATSVDDVVESILARRIGRQDALRSFKGLSEQQQQRILLSL